LECTNVHYLHLPYFRVAYINWSLILREVVKDKVRVSSGAQSEQARKGWNLWNKYEVVRRDVHLPFVSFGNNAEETSNILSMDDILLK
jgi:hypothetical protein